MIHSHWIPPKENMKFTISYKHKRYAENYTLSEGLEMANWKLLCGHSSLHMEGTGSYLPRVIKSPTSLHEPNIWHYYWTAWAPVWMQTTV